jgi:hypothetical protein
MLLHRSEIRLKRAGHSFGNGSGVCVQATGERMWYSVYVCVRERERECVCVCIKCGEVDFAAEETIGELVVLIVIARRT